MNNHELKPAHIKARKTANTLSVYNVLNDLESIRNFKFQYPDYLTCDIQKKVLILENHLHNATQMCKKILELLEIEVKNSDTKEIRK